MSVRSDKKEAGPRPRHPLSVEAFQWLLIGILAAVAATLGYIGFLRHALAEGIELSLSDLSYLTLQLFAIESGSATRTHVSIT